MKIPSNIYSIINMKFKIKIITKKHRLQTSLKLYYAIVLILLNQLETNAVHFNDGACEELSMTTNCECEKTNSDYEFDCSDTKETYRIEFSIYKGDDWLITCHEVNARDYNQMPNVSLGDYTRVQLRNCPTVGQVPIAEILQRLGVTQVEDLRYEINNIIINLTQPHLKGLQNLQVLRLILANVSHLAVDVFNHLPNLTQLHMRIKNIVDLPPEIFIPLKNLLLLDLSENNLKQLPADIFRNQRKLKYLNLTQNHLKYLEKLTFNGAISVKNLDLSFNDIENFNDPEVFQLLPELKKIKLDNNKFRELPADLLKYNKKLNDFSLTGKDVTLKQLPAKFFANLPQLGRIHVSCQLETAPKDFFVNSSSLTFIDLSHNKLRTLPVDFLADQHKLHTLDLSNNCLQTLPDNFFRDTYNLLVLKLAHNEIAHISTKTLAPLFNFKYLYIEEEKNSPLQLLDLSHNRIASLDSEHLKSFTRVSKELRLSNNQISTVNFSFIKENGDFNKTDDLKLDLSNNPLNCDCQLLDFVLFIQEESKKDCRKKIALETGALMCKEPFELANEPIAKIDPKRLLCSLDCNDREERNASSSSSSSCQYWRRSVDMTLIMNCTNALLTAVPEIPNLEKLKLRNIELNIENNKIIELPQDMLSSFANVTILIAAGNNIEKFEPINLPPSLTYLDLRRNHLERLPTSCLSMLNESQPLLQLYLSGNLWTCNCEARELVEFTKMNRSKVKDLDDLFCGNADHLHKRFQDISVWDICPMEKYAQIVFAIIAILSLMMFISSTFYYKYQLEVKVWLYAHNFILWRDKKELLDVTKLYDAFVSYTEEDEQFIVERIIPNLEKGPMPRFRLCIGIRDWVIGDLTVENIESSIKCSHRTIIVLSKSYIKSLWGRTEFRLAHINAMPQKCRRVIIILYEDVGDWSSLDVELRAYLKTSTYVKWNDRQFWNKLRYFLPHHSKNHKPEQNFFPKITRNLWRSMSSTSTVTLPAPDMGKDITNTHVPVENSIAARVNFDSEVKKNSKLQHCLASAV